MQTAGAFQSFSTPKPLTHIQALHTQKGQHDQLIEQTRKWVAQTFFGTLLKQARNSPFKSEIFDGGRGGQAFGELYDQRLAERMSRAAGEKLVNTIVRHIEAGKAYAQQTGVRAPRTPAVTEPPKIPKDANGQRLGRHKDASPAPRPDRLAGEPIDAKLQSNLEL